MTPSKTYKTLATAVLAAALLVLVFLPGPASASVSCDRVAMPGADAQEFAETLAPGQTGCFRAGEYSFEELKVSTPDITLAAYPGEAATLSGRIWVARGADDVTFSGLALDGRNDRELPSPSVNAAAHDLRRSRRHQPPRLDLLQVRATPNTVALSAP